MELSVELCSFKPKPSVLMTRQLLLSYFHFRLSLCSFLVWPYFFLQLVVASSYSMYNDVFVTLKEQCSAEEHRCGMIADALQAATQGVGGGTGAGAEKRGLGMPLGPPMLQRAHQSG